MGLNYSWHKGFLLWMLNMRSKNYKTLKAFGCQTHWNSIETYKADTALLSNKIMKMI